MEPKVPLYLKEIVHNVQRLYEQEAPRWHEEAPTAEDLAILEREATSESQFDRLRLRNGLWNDVARTVTCRVCKYGKVLVVSKGPAKVPWTTWARILQMFGGNFRICYFAAKSPRVLPSRGSPVLAEHINGGYTMPCDSSCVVVYREEESTRVLVHELMHASCLDPPISSVPEKEASIETWAELFLIGILSKGSLATAAHLWTLQIKWIHSQNEELHKHHSVRSLEDYSARYTLGRVHELLKKGITIRRKKHTKRHSSGRFTSPELDRYLVV